MKRRTTWILIADGARARIVVNEGPGSGVEQLEGADFRTDHPSSGDIISDRPGRVHDSADTGRHAMEATTDAHREAKRAFAAELAEFLAGAARKKDFDALVVVAPAQALGDLRGAFPDQVSGLVTGELTKDLTQVPNHDLAKHLDEVVKM